MNNLSVRKSVLKIFVGSLFFLLLGCTNLGISSTDSEIESAVASEFIADNIVEEATVTPENQQLVSDPSLDSVATPIGSGRLEEVLWLYETNNGCLLPCWWGVEPGKTDWGKAIKIFGRFDGSIHRSVISPTRVIYSPSISLPYDLFNPDSTRIDITVDDGVVQKLNITLPRLLGSQTGLYLNSFTLTNILTTYGEPDEIWLSTYPGPMEHNELPFRILLYYQDPGLMLSFGAKATVVNEEIVEGCPQQNGLAGKISLWSESANLSFEEVRDDYFIYGSAYRTLGEATTFSIKSFYDTFKDPAHEACLETLSSIWY